MNDYETLKKLHNNLRKSINNNISEETLLEKQELNDQLHKSLEDFLAANSEQLATPEFNKICKQARLWHFEINEIIKLKHNQNKHRKTRIKSPKLIIKTTSSSSCMVRKSSKHKNHKTIQNTMPKVDIKLGTTLVQMYDGTPDNLNSFLDAVALFNDTVLEEFATATPAEKATATEITLKFIKTRLTGNARQAISGAQTLNEILNKLKEQCTSKVNSDNIKAKLGALKQKGSLDDFCDQVERLTLRLAAAYNNEDIPANKAKQMATKQGVDTLINGLNNNDTKIILRAGKFENINDATQKIHECDQTKTTQAQVFVARGNHPQRSRGRGRGRFNGGRAYNNSHNRQYNDWRNNQQSQYSNYQHQQQYRSNHQRGQGNRGRGRYGPSMYNPQQQQATYFAQSQPQPWMQQHLQPVQQCQNANVQQQNMNSQQPINPNFLGSQFGPRTQ